MCACRSTLCPQYDFQSLLTVCYVPIKAAFPSTGTQFTLYYNAAGQLIALTGIIDVMQFVYCVRNAYPLSLMARATIKLWLIVMALGSMMYVTFALNIHYNQVALLHT